MPLCDDNNNTYRKELPILAGDNLTCAKHKSNKAVTTTAVTTMPFWEITQQPTLLHKNNTKL